MNLREINFEEFKNELGMATDDMEIVDYVSTNHGNDILKSFDNRPDNTGVALFFDKDDMKDIVMVIRSKGFDKDGGNGLILFALFDAYKNAASKDVLIQIINDSWEMTEVLAKSVTANIEDLFLKSLIHNA